MAMMSDAIGKIRGIASTYLAHPTMIRAKQVATQVATNPHVLTGFAVGGLAASAASFPSWRGNYNRNRDMGRGRANSYARATVAGYPKVFGGALLGAAGYGGYKAMGGYGGMKAAAMGAGAKAARWGSGMMSKMASMIG